MKLFPLYFHLSMPTQKFEEKEDSIQNRLFEHEGCLFPSETGKKDQNMKILGYSVAFNHRFIQKIIALL